MGAHKEILIYAPNVTTLSILFVRFRGVFFLYLINGAQFVFKFYTPTSAVADLHGNPGFRRSKRLYLYVKWISILFCFRTA